MESLSMATRSRWTKPRLVRAALLVGRGYTAEEVARDALVMSTASAVYQVMKSLGLMFSDAPRGNLMIDVGSKVSALADYGRKLRQPEPAEIVASRAMRILADDPDMLRNVLDDDT